MTMRALTLRPVAVVALALTAGCIARAPATTAPTLEAIPAFAVASPSGPTLAPGELAGPAPDDGPATATAAPSRSGVAAPRGVDVTSAAAAAPTDRERARRARAGDGARSEAGAKLAPGAVASEDVQASEREPPSRPAGASSAMASRPSALEPRPEPASCELGPAGAPGVQSAGSGARRYSLLPEVKLAPAIEGKLAQIAEAFFRRTGKPLVVTSGTRDPERQAEAMHELLRLGVDITKLYRNTRAAAEIARAFQEARAAGKPPAAAVRDLAAVIRRQIERGVFVSAHLRAGAVDVRNRDMSAAQRRAFLEGVAEVGGVAVLDEEAPPHFHLQLDP